MDVKLLNKILTNPIKEHLKRIIYHSQVDFIPLNPESQGSFNIQNSVNEIHHTFHSYINLHGPQYWRCWKEYQMLSHREKSSAKKEANKSTLIFYSFTYIVSTLLFGKQCVGFWKQRNEWAWTPSIMNLSGKQPHKQLLKITWIIFMTDTEGQFKQRDQG